jgi:Na+/melibiose symporter-like transporter
VSGWRLAAFLAPALPVGALGVPLALYLPPYFGSYVGLSLGTVGLAFSFVRLLDIVVDPLMGVLLDRTRSRWGQCRPWMIVGSALTAAMTLVVFLAKPGASPGTLVMGLLGIYGGVSILTMAHPAWGARLTKDYNERSRLYAWMQLATLAGTFLIVSSPMTISLFARLPPGGDVHIMGAGIALSLPLLTAVMLLSTREPPIANAHHGSIGRVRLRDYLIILRGSSMARIIMADALISIASGTSTATFIFFWRSKGLSAAMSGALVLVYLAAAVVSLPAWMWLARRIEKHRALIVSSLGYALIFPILIILPAGHFLLFVGAVAVAGVVSSAGAFLTKAMAADAADDARLQMGSDRTGQVYALFGTTAKVGSAVAIGGGYGLLQAVGYSANSGAANSAVAILVVQLLHGAFPSLVMLVAMSLFVGYRLGRAEHAGILATLAVRDAASVGTSR